MSQGPHTSARGFLLGQAPCFNYVELSEAFGGHACSKDPLSLLPSPQDSFLLPAQTCHCQYKRIQSARREIIKEMEKQYT